MSQHEHAEKAVNAAFEQSTEAGLAEILKGARVLVDEVKQSVQNLEDALNHLSANLPTIAEKAKHGKK